jgi:formiminoglutamate deiminase
MTMATTIHVATALLPSGWAGDVRLRITGGAIAAVDAGVPAQAGDERCAVLVPGMPNLHSHAFQRGMAGLAETRGGAADSFWSWRETMYAHALALTPDDVEAIAAELYVEMLEAGFTRVGEFHYLHHDKDGAPYADPAEMAGRIAAAAEASGIGLTLLPVFYAHAGFGARAPLPEQRRFVSSLDLFARMVEGSERHVAPLARAVVGIAPHSLRAVTPEQLSVVAGLRGAAPVHVHAAEQVREVEDCLAWSGARPVAWLLDNAEVDARWCLIHATHMLPAETQGLARSGAVAGLCPATEANLGDGVFDGARFLGAGGAFGVGSDSNVEIGVGAELRQLEYSQRLRDRARNVLARAGGSTGRALFDGALHGGARALGAPPPGILPGAPADLVALDADHPALVGRAGDALLDAWIFTGARAVDRVWVNGRCVVEAGRHVATNPIRNRFSRVMRRLAAL